MEPLYLFILFTTACLVTWIFLTIFYFVYTDKSRLRKNGYSREYIHFLREDYKKRSVRIAVAIPLLLLGAYGIFWLIAGKPGNYNSLLYLFLIFLLLVLPFPILDAKKSRAEYKKLALETNSQIIIDLKFRVLHKIFNPVMEIGFFVLFILYYFLIPEKSIPLIVYIHLIIPWFIYLSARNSKYLTRPLMKDGYVLFFVIITFNYLIVSFYIFKYGIKCMECLGNQGRIASIVLLVILMLKILIASFNFLNSRKYFVDDTSTKNS